MSIKSKRTRKEEQALFQKATEAMQLFAENPDALRGFLNALKKEDLAGDVGRLTLRSIGGANAALRSAKTLI